MSSPDDWFQLPLFVGARLLLTKPLGVDLTQVLDPRGRTVLDPIVGSL